MAFQLGIGKIKNFSFGLAILFFQLFMLVNTELFFPVNTDYWKNIITVYVVMTSVIFALPNLRQRIFNVKFRDALPKFLIFFLVTIFLVSLGGDIPINARFFSAVSQLPVLSLVMLGFHTFVVAINEESIFRNPDLEKKIGRFILNVFFACFHFVIYQGDLIYLFVAFVLGLSLSFIQQRFSPKSQIANMGVHAGYNCYVLGIVKTFQEVLN